MFLVTSIYTSRLNCDQAEKKGLIPFFHELPATPHFKWNRIPIRYKKVRYRIIIFLLRKIKITAIFRCLFEKLAHIFCGALSRASFSIILLLVTRMKKEKNHCKNLNLIRRTSNLSSANQNRAYLWVLFLGAKQKKSQILALYVYYALFPQEKYTDYSERT